MFYNTGFSSCTRWFLGCFALTTKKAVSLDFSLGAFSSSRTKSSVQFPFHFAISTQHPLHHQQVIRFHPACHTCELLALKLALILLGRTTPASRREKLKTQQLLIEATQLLPMSELQVCLRCHPKSTLLSGHAAE